ncbi:MAG: BspA family leucine-rich repeat surface protein [Bacteroidota bacterium]
MNHDSFKSAKRLLVAKTLIFHRAALIITFLILGIFKPSAQIISETVGTTTTVNVAGGEIFADPNNGTKGGVGGDCFRRNSGNSGDYPNCNCVTITTLTAPAGQQVSVTFSEFHVSARFDWLAIFDGDAAVNASNGSGSASNPSSSNPVLWNSTVDGDELVDMLLDRGLTFTSTNGSLTFATRFSGFNNTCGWEADVALCEGNTCPQPLTPPSATAFVTTWEVAANDIITIPLQSGTYDFDYTWQRLSDDTVISGTHTNADGDFTTNFLEAGPGTYLLSITGEFPHLKDYPVDKLLDVVQWGDIQWGDMGSMFLDWPGTRFLATDAPDLSQTTNMRSMFRNAANFNENLNDWDVSNITSMGQVFQGASNFNGNIRNWDVSQVTFFFRMFSSAASFNQNISGWEVSSANNMENMFDGAASFNQPIGNWDVRNVGNFVRMLASMPVFNQPLGDWKFKPNANFSQFASGTNNLSCQNYSATILGWNFNNPEIENLNLGGFNADYDATASIARAELRGRGWSLSAGTDIGGDCGTSYKFPCTDSLALSSDTLFGDLTLEAEEHISLDNIVINPIGATDVTSGGNIVLLPGFHALGGSEFVAKIDNVNCSGPLDTFNLRIKYASPYELANAEEIRAMKSIEAERDFPKKESPLPPNQELGFKVYPNPFQSETQLHFQLPEEQQSSLNLFDQMGRLVQTILPIQDRAAGEYVVDLRNERGLRGLYYVVLQTERERVVRKVMVEH